MRLLSMLLGLTAMLGTVVALTMPPAAGPAPRTVHVTTADWHFRMPDTISSGLVRFVLANDGPEPHHVQLVRIAGDRSLTEVARAMSQVGSDVPWATFVGGPEVPAPGDTTETIVDLTPGRYAVLCFVSSPNKMMHVARGMIRWLIVTPNGEAAQAPVAEAVIALRDHSFEVSGPLRAGRQYLRVENEGAVPHHVSLVRLGPGVTEEQARAWLANRKGPPPGMSIGGTTALAPGLGAWAAVDIEPGLYVLICFVRDARDGRAHVDHGMLRFVQVL